MIYQSSVLVYNETSEKFSVVQNKPFAPVSATNYLKDNDIVLVMKIVSEIRIYLHPILDWHEIINDDVNGTKFALTYCPLTGIGIAQNRVINGKETTFGVSGLLYNSI